MPSEDNKINVVGDVFGSNVSITQIYAAEAAPMRPQPFLRLEEAVPFSVDWLVFSQRALSFIGRSEEMEQLQGFLESPSPFCWWSIVGDAGTGKSRFALEATTQLTKDWFGGFISREHLNVRDAVTWRPTEDTLWVIDDAAGHSKVLQKIISMWALLFRQSNCKVRVLLLERGFNLNGGWWSELTGGMTWETTAVNHTLYRTPMIMPPLKSLARSFVISMCESIEKESADHLISELSDINDEQLARETLFGNPLHLQLWARELLSKRVSTDPSPKTRDKLVERHLARELDRISNRCNQVGLRFSAMLDLLFVTTAFYPGFILLDTDFLFSPNRDKILMTKGSDGRPRPATAGELLDLTMANRDAFNNLTEITGIEDIESYLVVLEETGLKYTARYSLQPDIVADELLKLMINAPSTPTFLKQLRGEFNAQRASRLIFGCLTLSYHPTSNVHSVFARLDDASILNLVNLIREKGKTIKYPLLTLREINMNRSNKVQFNSAFLFAPSSVHVTAPDVGCYFSEVRSCIAADVVDEATAERLAQSPHGWLLPYLDFLLDLSLCERAWLAIIISTITNDETLSLTNIFNFLLQLTEVLVYSFKHKDDITIVSDAERRVLARLLDAAMRFILSYAYPLIVSAEDGSFKEIYTGVIRAAIACGYGVGNSLFAREETTETRAQALKTLKVAHDALNFVPNASSQALVERNKAMLEVIDIKDHVEAANIYIATLDSMKQYASPDDYTATLRDMLGLPTRRMAPQLLSQVTVALARSPQHLVIASSIVETAQTVVSLLVGKTPEVSDYDRIASEIAPFCCELARLIRGAATEESASRFLWLVKLALDLSSFYPNVGLSLLPMFEEARLAIDEDTCSLEFVGAILEACGTAAYLWQLSINPQHLAMQRQLPFEVRFVEISIENLRSFASSEAEHEVLNHLKSINAVATWYQSGTRVGRIEWIFYPVGEFPDDDASYYSEQLEAVLIKCGPQMATKLLSVLQIG